MFKEGWNAGNKYISICTRVNGNFVSKFDLILKATHKVFNLGMFSVGTAYAITQRACGG